MQHAHISSTPSVYDAKEPQLAVRNDFLPMKKWTLGQRKNGVAIWIPPGKERLWSKR